MKVAQSYTVGSDLSSQQNGVVFANTNTVVSVSLSGAINLFDTRESSSSKWRTLYGPTKGITASVLSGESDKTFYTGSFDGGVKAFSLGAKHGESEGACADVEGTGHSARVSAMGQDGTGRVWSAGWDDKVTCIEGQNFV